MMDIQSLTGGLSMIPATAGPILLAVLGETLAERAGVINLSLNGTILLSAVAGFGVASATGSTLAGLLAGMVAGAAVAAVVAAGSIMLEVSQLASGFILAILCRDLAYFLGIPLSGRPAPLLEIAPVPFLAEIPWLGSIFFRQDLLTYTAFLSAGLIYFWIFHTKPGLRLRAAGENPSALHARGGKVNRIRCLYTIAGGALAGLAGPAFTLNIKAGWNGTMSGLDGTGWIVLAITIFGGWHPLRAMLGACLFATLQWLSILLQPLLAGLPGQIIQVAPFPLMILVLALVHLQQTEWLRRWLSSLPVRLRNPLSRFFGFFQSNAPAALGKPFRPPR